MNIGIGDGLTLFVDDMALVSGACLLNALNKQSTLSQLRHPYRIEAYNLTEGIGHGLMLDAGCHAEVFQIVVHEADAVVARQFVEVAQSLRHGDVVVGACNLLPIDADAAAQTDKRNQEVLHHLTISLRSSTARWTCSNIFNFSMTFWRLSF